MPWLALWGSAVGSGHLHSAGAAVIASLLDELHSLALSQRAEAVGDDVCLVHKQVVAATIGGDEAEALGGVEPPVRSRT